MRVDLKKVDAEITGIRPKLAAIAPVSGEASTTGFRTSDLLRLEGASRAPMSRHIVRALRFDNAPQVRGWAWNVIHLAAS